MLKKSIIQLILIGYPDIFSAGLQDLGGNKVNDFIGYLDQMSWKGRLFGKFPGFVSQLMPVASLKNRFIHGRKMISVFDNHQWAYCKECNFSYIHPQVTEAKLNAYYSCEYWSVRAPEALKEIIYADENIERPTKQLQFLKDNGLSEVDSMLDFGAGMCGAPTVFKRAGFCRDITIYDKSSQAQQIANILGVTFVGDLDEVGDKQFELIYSSHSLEHVPDLGQTLTRLSAMVKKGGHLFLEVPNIANRKVVELAHHAPHAYNFSEPSLRKALALYGFEVVDTRTYGTLVQDLVTRHKDKDLEVPDCILRLFKKVAD